MNLVNGCNVTLLADIWSGFNPGTIGWVVLSFIAACMGYAQLMAAIKGHRDNFGKKPSDADDIRKQAAVLENLKLELKDMAPAEKVDALIEKLALCVQQTDFKDAREEIRAIELLLPTFITRLELDARIDRFEEYQHKSTHALREEIQGNRAMAEAQREGLHNRMNVLTEVLYELRGIMRRKAPEVLT